VPVCAGLYSQIRKEREVEMPYNVKNPPDEVKSLPEHAQTIWVSAFNSAWEQYDGDEERCRKVAWAAVKNVYEKDAAGNWVKKEAEGELETVSIDDVEIMAVGTWTGSGGPRTYKKKDLDELVNSFNALSADSKLNYEPPVKLGHDKNQKLLQKDGYPSAGWVRSLKRVGDKLVASFQDVPKKIGDIIKAGGYKKVSSEINFEYGVGGKVWPVVLKAVSMLGGDIPAVKTIADIRAQYGEGDDFETVIYELAEGVPRGGIPKTDLERVMSHYGVDEETAEQMIKEKGVDALLPPRGQKVKSRQGEGDNANEDVKKGDITPHSPGDTISMDELNSGLDEWLAKAEAQIKGKAGSPAIRAFVKEVKGKLKSLLEKQASSDNSPSEPGTNNNNESEEKEDELMDKELRELLGLDENADVLEAVKGMKEKAESKEAEVSLAEHEDVKGKVAKLEQTLAERDRDTVVANAIHAGKVTPAQKEWADKYALADPEGFVTFVEAQPVVVDLTEKGGGNDGEDVQLTEAELRMAETMRVSKEDLIAAKKAELEVN